MESQSLLLPITLELFALVSKTVDLILHNIIYNIISTYASVYWYNEIRIDHRSRQQYLLHIHQSIRYMSNPITGV